MRIYGMITTMIIAAWGTTEYLINRTDAEFFHMVFVIGMVTFWAMMVYLAVTEPKRKVKAHWEKAGELEVMVMGRRKNVRK